MADLPPCWGIGLARTGSTSLCEAFRLLGYPRVEQDPTFEALRTLDAAAGATIVLHFKYLDFVFPGSKFVLTTRSLEGWLASMECSHRMNPRPIEGQHDRIARRMAIYETVGFDAPVLTAAYRRHHADVARYFAQRPSDLLVLDVTRGDGWDELCAFLGADRPDAPFPALNQGWAR